MKGGVYYLVEIIRFVCLKGGVDYLVEIIDMASKIIKQSMLQIYML